MDELAVNLASEVVDDRYLEVLIVVQAAVAKVPRKLLAVRDGFQVSFELDPDPIPHRDAVFHIEKEFVHANPQITATKIMNVTQRSEMASRDSAPWPE